MTSVEIKFKFTNQIFKNLDIVLILNFLQF